MIKTTRKEVRQQAAKERIRNFFEVALGYSKDEAIEEAKRCLECKDPQCVKGCPVQIDIPAFIRLLKAGKQKEALEIIKEKNNLPAICGRVCPQENQCEAACVLNKKSVPINIGALERYASDYDVGHKVTTSPGHKVNVNNIKVAVVGSGPAGLTCAADLAKKGYQVTIFESLHIPGGVLAYGIPEFRLPKEIVNNEIDYIRSLGVEIHTNNLIGNTYSLDDLFHNGFKAVFVSTGAGLPQFLGIEGEGLNRVYSANEFLTRINLMRAYAFPEHVTPINVGKNAVVIGGGNVALDCARLAVRLGAKVTLVYRRTEKEMPGRRDEVENAMAEGVVFKFLTQPIKILGDDQGFVKVLECMKMELGEPDESGRRRPVPVKDSNFVMEADTIVIAIGQNPNPLLPKVTPDLKTNKDGTVWVDENYMTSIPGVFAGGDIITGADTVISAMGAGKIAAAAIDTYIRRG